MTRVVVVGSINMDLVTVAPRFAGPGETVMGERFLTIPGGKGANQAVAAARLGAEVVLVGAVGDDAFGDQLHAGLAAEGVAMQHVRRVAGGSGTASITVADGENQIVIVAGANAAVGPAQVQAARASIAEADAVLVQMEVPLETVEATVRLGHTLGVPVILNPAPAQRLPDEWLRLTSYVTPNQHELAILLGADAHAELSQLIQRSPAPLVLTCGSEGAWYRDQGQLRHQPGFSVTAVDSTGAGDTFNAALAVFLREGLPNAVRKACAAGALSVSRLGAQAGMPRLADVDALLAAQP